MMTVKEVKTNYDYSFECCMSNEYKGYNDYDEFGCATMWLADKGVEYNFCIQSDGTNSSAIYKLNADEDMSYVETDYDTFVHYEVDFNDMDWIEKLEDEMCKTLIKFFDL